MKKLYLSLLLNFLSFGLFGQSWTWWAGDSLIDQSGFYGVKGVAAPANHPGARYQSGFWNGMNDDFWLFGGYGYYSNGEDMLSDLWRYSTTTHMWTWIKGTVNPSILGVKGVPSPFNMPGYRRSCATWVDTLGNLWLFGGAGYNTNNCQNDLWQFDLSTNEWTWMSGDSSYNQMGDYGVMGIANILNHPGARKAAMTWIDDVGNLYLFGGNGFDAANNLGTLNDLWAYSISTQMWTWLGGSNTASQRSLYGIQGVPSYANWPGARENAAVWNDPAGYIWLFGGFGVDSVFRSGYLNDVWRMTKNTGEWTWMNGSYRCNVKSNYGVHGVANVTNTPGGKSDFTAYWIDSLNNLWAYGGYGLNFSGSNAITKCDIWKYDTGTGLWTWSAGDTISCSAAFTVIGQTASTNQPGSRFGSAFWLDSNGKLWIMGGKGLDANDDFDLLNDLWESSYSTTSQEENFPKSLNKVYPNPTHTKFVMNFDDFAEHKIILRNMMGQLVLVADVASNESIDITGLAPGCYVVSADAVSLKLIVCE